MINGRAPRRARPGETPYRADGFSLVLPGSWADATVHTFEGPSADGLVHRVTVTSGPRDGRPLAVLADDEAARLAGSLRDGAVLLRDAVALDAGGVAERAVVRWTAAGDRALYQELVWAVVGDRTLTLAASFTQRSRRTMGPEVHRLMLSLATPPRR